MPVDIYFKSEDYPYYNPFEIEVIENVEIFLQQVEMILTTPKGTILGTPGLGIGLESYLWDLNISSSSIKQDILEQINEYISYETTIGIDYDIEVSFLKGEIWDTMIIDILIDGRKVSGYAITP
jgi:hypothetical protein